MKTYRVEANLKYPSCYNKGYEFEVFALTKAAAIKSARKLVRYEGHTKVDGPISYKAIELA